MSITPPAIESVNAVSELKANLAALNDPVKTPAEKAIALCWIEHLTGDLHQPLHAVNLYSTQHRMVIEAAMTISFESTQRAA